MCVCVCVCVCVCERHKDSWHVRLSSESSYLSSRGAALALTAGRSGRQGDRMGVSLRRRFRCAIDGRRMIKERKRKKQRVRLLLERHCELLHLQRKWTFNRPTHMPSHAYARTQASTHTYWTRTEWCFCVGSSCDSRDARQHFCCHKQFSFHNRKNQI